MLPVTPPGTTRLSLQFPRSVASRQAQALSRAGTCANRRLCQTTCSGRYRRRKQLSRWVRHPEPRSLPAEGFARRCVTAKWVISIILGLTSNLLRFPAMNHRKTWQTASPTSRLPMRVRFRLSARPLNFVRSDRLVLWPGKACAHGCAS